MIKLKQALTEEKGTATHRAEEMAFQEDWRESHGEDKLAAWKESVYSLECNDKRKTGRWW